jgi:hypothetical protein
MPLQKPYLAKQTHRLTYLSNRTELMDNIKATDSIQNPRSTELVEVNPQSKMHSIRPTQLLPLHAVLIKVEYKTWQIRGLSEVYQ